MKNRIFVPLVMALVVIGSVICGAYCYIFQFNFTPTPTLTSPYEIIDLYPSPNSINVSIRTEIYITFSREPPIVKLDLDPWARTDFYGVEIVGETARKIIFVLAEPLQLGITYTLTITYGEAESLQTITWKITTASAHPSPKPTPYWQLLPVRVFMWENEEWEFITADQNSPLIVFLEETLHRLNFQVNCTIDYKKVQEIIEHDKVLEMTYRFPKSFSISQWIEPKDRDHIKTDEKGYRILEEVGSVLFILEDNLDEGLEAHILVYSHTDWNWSCWMIKKEGVNEIDKSWIEGVKQELN